MTTAIKTPLFFNDTMAAGDEWIISYGQREHGPYLEVWDRENVISPAFSIDDNGCATGHRLDELPRDARKLLAKTALSFDKAFQEGRKRKLRSEEIVSVAGTLGIKLLADSVKKRLGEV